MSNFRFDRGSIDSHFDENGFLHVDGLAAKVGVMSYMNPDGSVRRELVTHETLFNADSMQSLRGVPVTNNHPPELINPDNYNKYAGGSVTESKREDSALAVSLSINNADAIEAVKSGKKELSCGYSVELDFTPGIWQGQHYDAIQTKRTYNHLAIVSKGRAGSECRLNLDAAEQIENNLQPQQPESKKMAEIKLPSGVSVNVDDAAVATAIQSELNNMQKRLDEAKEKDAKISELQANLDAKNEELQKRNDTDEITPVIDMIAQCKRLDADFDYRVDGAIKSIEQMQRDALAKAGVNVDGKDAAYVAARFDIALEQIEKENLEKQRKAGHNNDVSDEPVLSGREKFMAEQRVR
jgi:hypothetical protein